MSAPLVLLLIAVHVNGQTVSETEHAIDFGTRVAPQTELILHSRLRTQPGKLGVYQARFGSHLEVSLHERVLLMGGYYFRAQEVEERDIRGKHRFFGGFESQVLKTSVTDVEIRSQIERFTGEGPNYNRYRHRFRIIPDRKLAPYIGVEWLHDAEGLRGGRYLTGVLWKTGPHEIEAGYFFETRRPDVGADRHMVFTSFLFRRRE